MEARHLKMREGRIGLVDCRRESDCMNSIEALNYDGSRKYMITRGPGQERPREIKLSAFLCTHRIRGEQ